jgi:hypothetical protein
VNGVTITRRGALQLGGLAAGAAMAGLATSAYASEPPGRRFYAGSYTSAGGPGLLLGTADPAPGS